MAYNPLTYETAWEVSTAEKGTRYSIIRSGTKGDVACVPYGLTQDCKALATMIAATPDLIKALQGVQQAWDENRLLTSDEAATVRAALSKATLTV